MNVIMYLLLISNLIKKSNIGSSTHYTGYNDNQYNITGHNTPITNVYQKNTFHRPFVIDIQHC